LLMRQLLLLNQLTVNPLLKKLRKRSNRKITARKSKKLITN